MLAVHRMRQGREVFFLFFSGTLCDIRGFIPVSLFFVCVGGGGVRVYWVVLEPSCKRVWGIWLRSPKS